MRRIVVDVGRQMNGATFSLSPKTRAFLRAQGIILPPASSLFVSNDSRQAFEQLYGPMSRHIVQILTGLSERQVQDLGFTFVDPGDSAILLESHAAA